MSDIKNYQIEWQKIKIEITFKKNYFTSSGVSHIEVKADEQLPITESGYSKMN